MFAHISDMHANGKPAMCEAVLLAIREAKANGATFVVDTGDLTNDGSTNAYLAYAQVLQQSVLPIYATKGNREDSEEELRGDQPPHTNYRQYVVPHLPPEVRSQASRLQYRFGAGLACFIMTSQITAAQAKACAGTDAFEEYVDRQLDTCDAQPGCRWVFIGHHFPYPDLSPDQWFVVARHLPVVWLCGHAHSFRVARVDDHAINIGAAQCNAHRRFSLLKLWNNTLRVERWEDGARVEAHNLANHRAGSVSPPVVTCALTPDGLVLCWASQSTQRFQVLHSPAMTAWGAFSSIRTNLLATSAQNAFTNSVSEAPTGFFRIAVEP